MTALNVHCGRVFQFKRRHTWKESWLTLDKSGLLTWKRKDGFQVKGTVQVQDVLSMIKLETAEEKHMDINGSEPFFFVIPFHMDQAQKLTAKQLAVMNGQDFGMWLDAFAVVVNDWRLFKNIRDQQIEEIAKGKSVSVDNVEAAMTHRELVYHFKNVWEEFLKQRMNKNVSRTGSQRTFSMHESDLVSSSEEENGTQSKNVVHF